MRTSPGFTVKPAPRAAAVAVKPGVGCTPGRGTAWPSVKPGVGPESRRFAKILNHNERSHLHTTMISALRTLVARMVVWGGVKLLWEPVPVNIRQ